MMSARAALPSSSKIDQESTIFSGVQLLNGTLLLRRSELIGNGPIAHETLRFLNGRSRACKN